MPQHIHVTHRIVRNVAIIVLEREFILDTDGDVLRQRVSSLLRDGLKLFVINLAKVSHLDASGIGAIVGSRSEIARHGGRFAMCCASDRVMAIFRLIQIGGWHSFATEEEAIAEVEREWSA